MILMRTQYNALLQPGCASTEDAALASVTLEGADGTVLDRGLNDRIRSVAEKYGAQVVDLFLPFAVNAANPANPESVEPFVAAECTHPSGAGHQAIATLTKAAFLVAQ